MKRLDRTWSRIEAVVGSDVSFLHGIHTYVIEMVIAENVS